MSIQVGHLVRRGYIRRNQADDDARKARLTLTPPGQRIKKQNTVLDPDLVRSLMASMSAVDREAGLRGIERLAHYAAIMTKQKSRSRKR